MLLGGRRLPLRVLVRIRRHLLRMLLRLVLGLGLRRGRVRRRLLEEVVEGALLAIIALGEDAADILLGEAVVHQAAHDRVYLLLLLSLLAAHYRARVSYFSIFLLRSRSSSGYRCFKNLSWSPRCPSVLLAGRNPYFN